MKRKILELNIGEGILCQTIEELKVLIDLIPKSEETLKNSWEICKPELVVYPNYSRLRDLKYSDYDYARKNHHPIVDIGLFMNISQFMPKELSHYNI